jgi:Protein of unknown function (DUF2652)
MPDISGFTQFVKETEIDHSSHIVSELLEVLINQDHIGFELSEIEGDALFFYKRMEIPSNEQILEQCEEMYLKFHQHLKVYERDRICHCGACSTANRLGLKFIVHIGEALVKEIHGKTQLMGIDVTRVHRLTKNSIPGHEYVLLSETGEDYFPDLPEESFGAKKEKGESSYNELGTLEFSYYALDNLSREIPEPPPRKSNIRKIENPVKASIKIHRSMLEVHQHLIDLNLRKKWKAKTGGDFHLPERVGTQHFCVLPQGNVKVKVLAMEFRDNKIIYIEQFVKKGILSPDMTEIYTLESVGLDFCQVKIEAHPIINSFLSPLVRPLISKIENESLKKLKFLCEQD